METPPRLPFTRQNRNVLLEIPSMMGSLALSVDATDELSNSHLYKSPHPSPDELVIQLRGRRKFPVTWSPDIDTKPLPRKDDLTPVKQVKSSIVLRSTPRKRLLSELNESNTSPRKDRNGSPTKKCRLEEPMPLESGTLHSALRALASEQLVNIIELLVGRNPSLEKEIKTILPAPDLRPLENRLHDLKRNIFKSLPNSRLTSKTDSPAFSRASTHILAFKKCVREQGRMLVSSQQWDSVCDYVLMAWKYVQATPLWDNPPHNVARKQCFKFLAAQCMVALKKVNWTLDRIEEYYPKVQECLEDCEDIQSCLKQLDSMKESFNVTNN